MRFGQNALGLRITFAIGAGHEGPGADNDVRPTILAKRYSTGELARMVPAAPAA